MAKVAGRACAAISRARAKSGRHARAPSITSERMTCHRM